MISMRVQREGGWCAAQMRVDQGPSVYKGRHLTVQG